MKTDLYLIRKYWLKNKSHLIKLLISIILLVTMLLFVTLIEQTECRRKYDHIKRKCGASNIIFNNVSDDIYNELSEQPEVKDIGRIFVCGNLGDSGIKYSYGYYEDKTAEKLDYLEMLMGRMPEKNGEVAVYDYALEELYPGSSFKDILNSEIQLKEYDFENNYSGDIFLKVVGIIKSYDTRELTECSNLWQLYTATPMPSVFLYSDACQVSGKYNYTLITHTLSEYENDKSKELSYNFRKKCFDNYKLTAIGADALSAAASEVMDYQAGNEMYQDLYLTDTMQIIKYFSALAVIISAVSLFGTLFAIMNERVTSLRLIKILGYSNLRLARLIALELISLYTIGLIIGLVTGIVIYESTLFIQHEFWQLPLLSGFKSEWAVKQVTENPFLISFICSFAAFFSGYMIYGLKLLLFKKIRILNKKKAKSFRAIKNKIYGDAFTDIMQVLVILLVIFTSTVFYSYYSMNGKGDSYFTNPELSGDMYYEYAGINMKDENIDICIYNSGSSEAIGPMVYNDTGITEEALSNMKNINGISNIRAYSINIAANITYPKDSDNVPPYIENNLRNEFTEEMEKFYGAENTAYYRLSMIKCNDDSIQNLSEYVTNGEIGKLSNGVTIVYSEQASEFEPYKVGDIIPMTAISATGDKMNIKECNKFEVVVEAIATIPDSAFDNDPIIYNVFNSEIGVSVAITSDTILNTYKECYDYAYIKYTADAKGSTVMSEIKKHIKPTMNVKTQSLIECNDEFTQSRIERYIGIIFILIMLAFMTIIGYLSLISMKIHNSRNSTAILRALGLNKKRTSFILLLNNVRLTLFSCGLGGISIYILMKLMENKYKEASLLYEKYGMMGNDYDKYAEITKIRKTFLLDYEMYNVPVLRFMLIICAFLLFVTALSVLLITRKKYNISNELNNQSKE